MTDPISDRQWGAYVAVCAERDRYREALRRIAMMADQPLADPMTWGKKKERQRIVTDEFLREVASVYKKCDDGRPTKAVMDHYITGKRNAARWVSLAREAGFLEPYVRTKGRTSETKGN